MSILRVEFRSGVFKLISAVQDEPDKVRVIGATAVLTRCATVKQEYKGKDTSGQFRDTTVWVKRDGCWQILSWHGSKVVEN